MSDTSQTPLLHEALRAQVATDHDSPGDLLYDGLDRSVWAGVHGMQLMYVPSTYFHQHVTCFPYRCPYRLSISRLAQ